MARNESIGEIVAGFSEGLISCLISDFVHFQLRAAAGLAVGHLLESLSRSCRPKRMSKGPLLKSRWLLFFFRCAPAIWFRIPPWLPRFFLSFSPSHRLSVRRVDRNFMGRISSLTPMLCPDDSTRLCARSPPSTPSVPYFSFPPFAVCHLFARAIVSYRCRINIRVRWLSLGESGPGSWMKFARYLSPGDSRSTSVGNGEMNEIE